jgi:hypothetical protein
MTMLRALLFFVLSFVVSCGSQPGSSEATSPEAGTLRFNLVTATESGRIYRLVNATFAIEGPVNVMLPAPDNDPWVDAHLPIGSYTVELLKGWTLEGARNTPVLVSPNPQPAQIENQTTTHVVFVFDDTGEAIAFGDGRARISIKVLEPTCGNGVLDAGEECDFAIHDFCDESCSGGPKSCSQPSDCASGSCGPFKACTRCDDSFYDCERVCHEGTPACTKPCHDGRAACGTSCDASRDSCIGSCDTREAACKIACGGPINFPCYLACDAVATQCDRGCNDTHGSCQTTCDGTRSSCLTSCEASVEGCVVGCDTTRRACSTSCDTCAPCNFTGSCPYAARYLSQYQPAP